jgi:hypothetical protein
MSSGSTSAAKRFRAASRLGVLRNHRRRFLHDARNILNPMMRSSAQRPRVLAFSPKPRAAGEPISSPAAARLAPRAGGDAETGITQLEFLQGKACSKATPTTMAAL